MFLVCIQTNSGLGVHLPVAYTLRHLKISHYVSRFLIMYVQSVVFPKLAMLFFFRKVRIRYSIFTGTGGQARQRMTT